jgi:hypothetical protein
MIRFFEIDPKNISSTSNERQYGTYSKKWYLNRKKNAKKNAKDPKMAEEMIEVIEIVEAEVSSNVKLLPMLSSNMMLLPSLCNIVVLLPRL